MTPTQHRILEYLEINPDSPTKQIMQALGIARITAQRSLKALHDTQSVYISSYQKTYATGAGSASPAYSVGNEPDIQKRATQKKVSHQIWLEHQRNRRRLERIKSQSTTSPFGTIIAQLTLEKRK